MKPIIINTPKGFRKIGLGNPAFIVAEMSGNHHCSLEEAKKIIDAAVHAQVDAIKIQTYTPDTITIDSDKDYFRVKVNDAWAGQTLYQLYRNAYTPWEWQKELKQYAESKGLFLFSTAFDETAVDFLEDIGVEMYKVASFELIDIPLLKKIAKTKKPVIISRGMASIEEIQDALHTLKTSGCSKIAILHCISSYPTQYNEMNLATISDISKKFDVVSGLSDHSLDPLIPLTAVAKGASIIEKHLTLKRSEGGPDAAFSLEPQEFRELVQNIRKIEIAIGRPSYGAGPREKENIIFRKSLFAVEDIKKGERFTHKNIRSIRPGHGLLPKFYNQIINKTATQDIERATPLSWDLIEKI